MINSNKEGFGSGFRFIFLLGRCLLLFVEDVDGDCDSISIASTGEGRREGKGMCTSSSVDFIYSLGEFCSYLRSVLAFAQS
jgi:hypothetical protein